MASIEQFQPNPTASMTDRSVPVHLGPVLDVDFLIVGAGPAGASLGCFLGRYGMDLVSWKRIAKPCLVDD
jgi:ribulose 1,5-bisphosphate synthetase/thiazole synthase